MTRLPGWTLPALLLAVAACGGESGGSAPTTIVADCATYASPGCWNDAVLAASACVDPADIGAFDATYATCAYGNGVTVEFDPTAFATASAHLSVPWRFTVKAADATPCARYVEAPGSTSLTTRLGTVTRSTDGVTCPDGSRYVLADGVVCGISGPVIAVNPDGLIAIYLVSAHPHGWTWQCR